MSGVATPAGAAERRALLEKLLREKAAPPSRPFELVSAADRERLPADAEDAYPLTRLQAGMLFFTETAPDTAVYHDIFRHDLRCRFDAAALAAAAGELARRHPVLRTSFALTGYEAPLQIVHREVELTVEIEDLSHLPKAEQDARLDRWEEEERRRPFDVGRAPLLRLVAHRRSADTFHLAQSFHHAILDGWSVATLNTELFQLYYRHMGEDVPPLAAPPRLAFRDYVALERDALGADEHRRFWLDLLAGAERTELPRWGEAAGGDGGGPRRIEVDTTPFGAERSAAIAERARRLGVSVKALLLAAHLAVLRLHTGRRDVVTGLVTNGRPEELEGERVIGLFLNSVPFRLALPAGGSWADLVRATFEREKEILRYRRFPMAEVQADLRAAGSAEGDLFDALFTFVNFHVYRALGQLRDFEHVDARGITETNYDFQAFFFQSPFTGELGLRLDYEPGAFPPPQVAALRGSYLAAVERIVETPEARWELTPPLAETDRRRLVAEWNDTGRAASDRAPFHRRVAARAAEAPQAAAVVAGERVLSFAELTAGADRLAHLLVRRGVAPEARVGVAVGRSPEQVTAVLAVLAAGGAFVHLDPTYPTARLAQLAADPGMAVVVADAAGAERMAALDLGRDVAVLRLDELSAELAAMPAGPPAVEVELGHPAYVIHTSGSSGVPKGVVVSHGSLSHLADALEERIYRGRTEIVRVSLNGSLAFDTAVKQLVQLAFGRALVVIGDEERLDPAALVAEVGRRGVDALDVTPSQLRLLLDAGLGAGDEGRAPRLLLVGGEAIDPRLWGRLAALEGIESHNLYGPTETTVDATTAEVAGDRPHVGRPLAGVRAHVLDGSMQPLPPGVPGELYLGGDGVARGYLGRPAATAAVFVPDPFAGDATDAGGRLYRTGDRVRLTPAGEIEFVGRLDRQVKVRGHRVELGEIETVLGAHPRVAEAVVEAFGDDGDDPGAAGLRLVAFLVPAAGDAGGDGLAEELAACAAERLPEPMVPAGWSVVGELPRLPNGKVDRAALAEPERAAAGGDGHVAPRTPFEERLAALWAEVLKLDRVGIEDDFFAIGGHSLLAMQLVLRVRQEFDVDLPLLDLVERPNVAALAARIVELSAAQAGEDDGAALEGLLSEVEGMSDEELASMLEDER